jgi:hypothetical protein
MALTRYRLPASGAAAVSPAIQSYTHTQSTRRPLPTSDATALATQAYTPDAADDPDPGDAHHVQLVSAALTTGTVFDVGNAIKLAIQGLEAHAANNLNVQLWAGVYSNDGATLRQTLLGKTEQASELGTALAGRFLSTTVANAYTTIAGDRLVIEVSVEGDPGGGGGVQGHNASLRWGSDGAGGDLAESDGETGTTLNPWFEIEDTQATIVEAEGASAGAGSTNGLAASVPTATGASTGAASVAAIAAAIWLGLGAVAAGASVNGIGAGTAGADGASSAVAVVTGSASVLVLSEGAASGVAVVTGEGEDAAGGTVIEADGASAGVASANGMAVAFWLSDGASEATASVSGVGAALTAADGASTGAAQVSGIASALVLAEGAAAAIAIVTGQGQVVGGFYVAPVGSLGLLGAGR